LIGRALGDVPHRRSVGLDIMAHVTKGIGGATGEFCVAHVDARTGRTGQTGDKTGGVFIPRPRRHAHVRLENQRTCPPPRRRRH
jgi:hypothetical protein